MTTCLHSATVNYLAILAADAIALPLQPAFPAPELKYILDQSQTNLLLATETYAEQAASLIELKPEGNPVLQTSQRIAGPAPPLPQDDVRLEDVGEQKGGMMLYTSGTTNKPVRPSPSSLYLGLGRPANP
ncbi:hypothetical protein KEM55_008596 [Ascosphaera atra]|nr:hypothetical protein KEM55_008596 [Ascosphaera atra]